ncbi:MAG: pyridoxamine 5'-phosphate oxidase [Balneola sp.]|nr:MAG: pyridoxamine 5'-phosphate oxidase [Balneola sp.]
MANIQDLRREYSQSELDEKEVDSSPVKQFQLWFEQAVKADILEPNAMSLATLDFLTRPHNRIVLLKGFDENGFTFFTNYESSKGGELASNPYTSCCFFWKELERQVRIEGEVSKISKEESEAYFRSRPRMSQLGALASRQSMELPDRNALEQKFEELQKAYEGKEISMPDYWGGYLISPCYFEFWQGRQSRLHDRISYTKEKGDWIIKRLSP